MRIENTRVPDIIKPNVVKEETVNISTTTDNKSVKSINGESFKNHIIKKTSVEKGFASLSKELDKLAIETENQEILILKEKISKLTNSLSKNNGKSIQDEGWSLHDTDIETIVTVVDKIKMELAKAGVDISIFGDNIGKDQVEAMGGSSYEAFQIEQSLKKADLPYTAENKEDFETALEQAQTLTECSDGTIKYLLDNELEPTIGNLYKAQHSGSDKSQPPKELDSHIRQQMEGVILSAGLTVNNTTLGYGSFLMENDIPVTANHLQYIDSLKNLELPKEMEVLVDAMATAVSEGNRPEDAVLIEEYTLTHRAEHGMHVIENTDDDKLKYLLHQKLPLTIEEMGHVNDRTLQEQANSQSSYAEDDIALVTARRQLEEIRLVMTVQSNYMLLKQGISIETQPMEQLIDDLKGVEDQYYQSLLSQNEIVPSAENVAMLKDTLITTEEVKQVPAYVLGAGQGADKTLQNIHETGQQIQSAMQKAGEAYETLMTSPRADLGDSIQKAFQNVDDILEDLGMETNGANERAVRILAYNNLEITDDSILEMKASDQKVQVLFQNLTPSVVIEMMKRGISPLDMNVDELNKAAEQIKTDLNIDTEEKFSTYLWKLEQKSEITPEERNSYIGMYRMLHQVEQTDGAVIGALVHQGADITINNLLTAVRSGKATGMDVSLDDNYSTVYSNDNSGMNITEQIASAYQTDCAKEVLNKITPDGMQQLMANEDWEELTPEQVLWKLKEEQQTDDYEEQYLNHQLEEFANVKNTEDSVLRMLSDYDMPLTTHNLMAGNHVMHRKNQIFNQLFDPKNMPDEINFDEIKQEILEEFAEALKTPEDMAKAQDKLADLAENAMKTMMESETVQSVDIRNLKVMRQEIKLNTKMAKEENYAIPVIVSGEMTNVQLKIVRGTREKGRVDVLFESNKLGKVVTQLKIEPDKMTGYIVSDEKDTLSKIQDQEADLAALLNIDGTVEADINFIHSANLALDNFSERAEQTKEDIPQKDSEDYHVQTKVLYGAAKSLLSMLKGLE